MDAPEHASDYMALLLYYVLLYYMALLHASDYMVLSQGPKKKRNPWEQWVFMTIEYVDAVGKLEDNKFYLL